MARFATFCQHAIVLPVTEAIFDRAADLWVLARQGGHPRNDADLIIADGAYPVPIPGVTKVLRPPQIAIPLAST